MKSSLLQERHVSGWSWGEMGEMDRCGTHKGGRTLSSRAGRGERNRKVRKMVSCSEYTPSAIKQVYGEILKLPRRLGCYDAVFLVR